MKYGEAEVVQGPCHQDVIGHGHLSSVRFLPYVEIEFARGPVGVTSSTVAGGWEIFQHQQPTTQWAPHPSIQLSAQTTSASTAADSCAVGALHFVHGAVKWDIPDNP